MDNGGVRACIYIYMRYENVEDAIEWVIKVHQQAVYLFIVANNVSSIVCRIC